MQQMLENMCVVKWGEEEEAASHHRHRLRLAATHRHDAGEKISSVALDLILTFDQMDPAPDAEERTPQEDGSLCHRPH